MFERIITTDDEGNEQIDLNEIIGINGTVAGDTINLIKLNIPNHITANIGLFPTSMFTLEKSRLLIYGKTSAPRIRGSVNLLSMDIPELLTKSDKINLKFEGQETELKVDNLLLNNSDINISSAFKFLQSGIFKIDKLKLTAIILVCSSDETSI